MYNKELYIGVMSGTSLDGVDVALCEINATSITLLHYKEYSISKELKTTILETISSSQTLKSIGVLDHKLGLLYTESILDFLDTYKINIQ